MSLLALFALVVSQPGPTPCADVGSCDQAAISAATPEAALPFQAQACALGSAGACWRAGDNCRHRDKPAEAIPFLKQSCDLDDARGCVGLAELTWQGRGLTANRGDAVRWYQRACALQGQRDAKHGCDMAASFGNLPTAQPGSNSLAKPTVACTDVNACHVAADAARAKGDFSASLELYRRECELGGYFGCNGLAAQYQAGEGVAADLAKAIPLYVGACAGENVYACANLAYLHAAGLVPSLGLPEALIIYRKACDLGHADWCLLVARMHRDADRVPQNDATAIELYGRACQLGSAVGCTGIGLYDWKGTAVHPASWYHAGLNFERGCTLGDPNACAFFKKVMEEERSKHTVYPTANPPVAPPKTPSPTSTPGNSCSRSYQRCVDSPYGQRCTTQFGPCH